MDHNLHHRSPHSSYSSSFSGTSCATPTANGNASAGNTHCSGPSNDFPRLSKSTSNARRLELRNAGFRAALLPARRLSPPQGLICNASIKVESVDSTDSSSSASASNILQEISNSARRRENSRTPLADIFGFADDEKEFHTQINDDDMLYKTGSVRSIKNKKKVRRIPSFQSNKYIEYLETELGAVTEKLDSLQSPETVRGQAAKIRKLERKIEELTRHLNDWEANYEERVNDQVFERLHGESDLRLKIVTLEQTAVSKEAHIAELGKELEDTKLRLLESESVETTLTRRLDVLTELLAKSPTRTSFADFDTPVPPKAPGPRFSTSPTRQSNLVDGLDSILKCGTSASPILESNLYNSRHNEQAILSDTESVNPEDSSRPVSGIFSSRSSQTGSSRPTSIFSTSSFGAWSGAEDKAVTRPRRSRRFAPGATALKPLLLPTTAGLSTHSYSYDTPKRESLYSQSDTTSPWESADDLPSSTPNRPSARKPYPWAQSPGLPIEKSIKEDDESADDTFTTSMHPSDTLPDYLRHLAQPSSPNPIDLTIRGPRSSPVQTRPSLHAEFRRENSFSALSDGSCQIESSPCPAGITIGSNEHTLIAQDTALQTLDQELEDDSFMSNFSDSVMEPWVFSKNTSSINTRSKSSQLILPAQLRDSYVANLVVELRKKPLNLAKHVILQSWTRSSGDYKTLACWILGLIYTPRKHPNSSSGSLTLSKSPSSSTPAIAGSAPTILEGTAAKLGLSKMLPKLQAMAFSASTSEAQRRCPYCTEPPGRRRMRLWAQLAVALIAAIGYALVEGPATVLSEQQTEKPLDADCVQTNIDGNKRL